MFCSIKNTCLMSLSIKWINLFIQFISFTCLFDSFSISVPVVSEAYPCPYAPLRPCLFVCSTSVPPLSVFHYSVSIYTHLPLNACGHVVSSHPLTEIGLSESLNSISLAWKLPTGWAKAAGRDGGSWGDERGLFCSSARGRTEKERWDQGRWGQRKKGIFSV